MRLGIDAPKEIPVHRQEVYDAIQRENQRSQESAETAVKEDPVKEDSQSS